MAGEQASGAPQSSSRPSLSSRSSSSRNRPEEVNLPAIEIYEQHGEFAGMTVEQIKAKIKPKRRKRSMRDFPLP